jgi:hypothetical protein
MFTPNEQTLAGVKDVMQRAVAGQAKLTLDREKLIIVPISARDETLNEYELSKQWRGRFAQQLRPFFMEWIPSDETAERVLNFIKIPYSPYWSFGERLPVLEEDPHNPKTLAFSYELIARLIYSKLNWEEVRKGSLSAEAEATQKAEAERRAAEAARLREQSQRDAAAREAEARRTEEAQLAERVDKFMQSRFRPAVTTARRFQLLGVTLMISGALMVIYLGVVLFNLWDVPPEFSIHVRSSDAFAMTALSVVAGVAGIVGWELFKRTSALIKYYGGERARFETNLDPYAQFPARQAFALFAQTIESAIAGGLAKAPTVAALATSSAMPSPNALPSIPLSVPPGSRAPSRLSLSPVLDPWSSTPELPRGFDDARTAMSNSGPYDVFISHSAGGISTGWLREFIPLFTAWLTEMLGRDAKVLFSPLDAAFDSVTDFKEELASARCMVAILTPSYFRSNNTRSEWDSFALSPTRALIPVLLHKSDGYPPEVQSLQQFDFSEYAYLGEGFSKTERYIDFQAAVRKLVEVIAEVIKQTDSTKAAVKQVAA